MNKLITHSFQPMRPNQPQKAKKHVIQLYGWSLTLGTTHLVIGTTQDDTEMQQQIVVESPKVGSS
jgi:hypothetical protein